MHARAFAAIDRKRGSEGFSLLEVIVALAIAGVAITVILSHIRVLTQHQFRLLTHEREATATLNEAERFLHLLSAEQDQFRPDFRAGKLSLHYIGRADPSPPDVAVFNYSHDPDTEMPELHVAYTPHQEYRIATGDRYGVSLLLPSTVE